MTALREDVNLQWRVARRPVAHPVAEDFELTEAPIPSPGAGEVLLRTRYLGLAPVMRMYMQGTGAAGERALQLGDVIHGRGVAEVVESRHPDFVPGDLLQGQLGWQTWSTSALTARERFHRCPDFGLPFALSAGVLGMTGMSAWAAIEDRCPARAEETVVVSAAAGGVGSLVVQMARARGARVIGIAGSRAKVDFLLGLGCEGAIDYRRESVAARLDELCPGGIDLYFDNVGGETLSLCLERLAMHARVLLCGSIPEYTRDEPYGLTNVTRLRAVNGTMLGYFVYHHLDRWDEAMAQMAGWIHEGRLRPVQDVVEGFEGMPAALMRLYDGDNIGVQICSVRGEPRPDAMPPTHPPQRGARSVS